MFFGEPHIELLHAFIVPDRDIEICMFTSIVGNFAVVMREGKGTKGSICVSYSQAHKLFKGCVERTVNRFQLN